MIRNLFYSHVAQTSPEPLGLEIASGRGSYLYAPDGTAYLDLISGIAVSNVGHSAPEVVAAVQQQAAAYMHTMVYGEHIQAPQVRYATRLVELLGENLNTVYFTNSGSEAVEGALKIAKKYTQRTEIIACHNAYHGSTHGALSVTDSWIKEGYAPFLPEVRHIPFNDFQALSHITERTACFIVEPIQGEAGIILPAAGYLQAVQQRCREVGAIFILDEIQTGFGRTGAYFAHQKYGIMPDILLLGKALGGGMPLGAFIGRRELMSIISHNPILGHITTFGGHPLSCAAGLAAFNKLIDENLLASLPAKERLLQQRLTHSAIREVRGTGLMYVAVLDTFEHTYAAMHACLRRGVLTDWFLNMSFGLRICPPLTISERELAEGCDIVCAALSEVYSKG